MKKNLLLTLVSILATTLFSYGQIAATDYVTTWKTDNIGTSLSNQISIPAEGEYTVYYESIPAGTSGSLPASGTFTGVQTITLPAAGTYRIAIKPTGATPFHRVVFADGGGDPLKLLTIEQWGNTVWSSMEGAYFACENLAAISATDAPVLTNVTSMRDAFFGCLSLSSVTNMNNWDVSAVTDMRYMFQEAYAFNEPIGNWDVSAVTDMRNMFQEAYAFNQPIGNWDVSAVTSMFNMFWGASAFNQPIDNWDVSAVKSIGGMFQRAAAFNQPIGKWSLNPAVVMSNMLTSSGMDCQNYSATLMGWAANPATPFGRSLGATGRAYGPYASDARNSLTVSKGWTITGDNLNPSCTYQIPATDYVTTWKTDNPGTSLSNQITIPAIGEYTVYYESIPAGTSGTLPATGHFTDASTITFPTPGTYRIAIKPAGTTPFHQIRSANDSQKLLTIEQWGSTVWSSFENAYNGCYNLSAISATDTPVLNQVTSMARAFDNCHTLSDVPQINNWDVSAVTDMRSMFRNALAFNQPIGNWDVSAVTYMSYMFAGASSFNQPIGSWDVSAVTTMNYMFEGASSFNQPIGKWNVSAVANMSHLFDAAVSFNQPLDNWNASTATDMSHMFADAKAFNQPLNKWDVSKVTAIRRMLYGAATFNQSLSNWTINAGVQPNDMLRGTAMDCQNYSATLMGWAANPATPTGRILNATGLQYGPDAVAARDTLILAKGWTIANDVLDPTCTVLPVKLISFSAQPVSGKTVEIKWQTSQETQNERFVIERSKDLTAFETVMEIRDVAGNSNDLQNYHAVDPTPYPGTSYYRLVQYDLDGTRTASHIVSVVLRATEYALYPNPIQNQYFNISVDEPITANIIIYDATGKKIEFSREAGGLQTVVITPLHALASGTYTVIINERGTKRTFKLTVQ